MTTDNIVRTNRNFFTTESQIFNALAVKESDPVLAEALAESYGRYKAKEQRDDRTVRNMGMAVAITNWISDAYPDCRRECSDIMTNRFGQTLFDFTINGDSRDYAIISYKVTNISYGDDPNAPIIEVRCQRGNGVPEVWDIAHSIEETKAITNRFADEVRA